MSCTDSMDEQEYMITMLLVNDDDVMCMCFSYAQPCGGDGVSSLKFLPSVSQEIIEEFALRYSVESIFRMMV